MTVATERYPSPIPASQIAAETLRLFELRPTAGNDDPAQQAAWRDAKNRIIVLNRPLVLGHVTRFPRKLRSAEDCIQDGLIGLDRAADLFDPARGIAFSTYATLWVRKVIGRSAAREAFTITVPHYLFHDAVRAQRQDDPSPATSSSPVPYLDEAVSAMRCRAVGVALNPSRDEEAAGLRLGLESRPAKALSPLEELIVREEANLILELAERVLKPRQFQVIQLRYLDSGNQPTAVEVARVMGVSPQRVRMIEKVSLTLLRIALTNPPSDRVAVSGGRAAS